MRRRDRGCLNKRRFSSKEECEASIARTPSLFQLFAYKCPYSEGKSHWHKTKKSPEGGTREAQDHSRISARRLPNGIANARPQRSVSKSVSERKREVGISILLFNESSHRDSNENQTIPRRFGTPRRSPSEPIETVRRVDRASEGDTSYAELDPNWQCP